MHIGDREGESLNKLPKKFVERVASNLKKYQRITLAQQKSDVAEADTVTLIKDILAEVFGYDKYDELTSEHQIKSTYCDLAIKIGGKLRLLVEVKSAGSGLADNHLRQVIDYGAHQGIHWVILTNAVEWRLVRIYVANQISHEEVCRIVLADMNPKNEDHLQCLFLFAKEGLTTDAMDAFHQQAQLFNKFTVSAIIRSEAVISVVRREIRKLFPDIKVGNENLSLLIENEVIKRDTVEGDKAKEAVARMRKALNKLERAKNKVAKAVVVDVSN
ncbi:restriction endonuclease subunit R [Mesorhizobium sp. M7A.T.Ca.TU.009.01.3.1]|nr:restriction endonuclease subunit R [Mesorhizobium sp. M7A.T.Ca.TU.009.01.3.1]